jgi:hypothetical protein
MLKQAEVLRLLFVHVAVDELNLVHDSVRNQGSASLEPVLSFEEKSVKGWRDQALKYVSAGSDVIHCPPRRFHRPLRAPHIQALMASRAIILHSANEVHVYCVIGFDITK